MASSRTKPELTKNLIIKLVITTPEQDRVALLRGLQRHLHTRIEMRRDPDFDIAHSPAGETPGVIFGQALDAFQAGRTCRIFALVADKERHDQLAAIDCGIQNQIDFLPLLRNQGADNVHASPFVITESIAGLGIDGEIGVIEDDGGMQDSAPPAATATKPTPAPDLWHRTYRNPSPVEGISVLAVINDRWPYLHALGHLQIRTVGSNDAGICAHITIDLTPAQMRAVAATLQEQADYLDQLTQEAADLNAAASEKATEEAPA